VQLNSRQLSSRQAALPWRSGRVPATGYQARSSEPVPSGSFLGQLDWMLGRLSTAHVRITFVRLELRMEETANRRAAERIAEELDDSYGLAGMLADGSVMAAFFGPREPGSSGDRQQSQAILRRIEDILQSTVGPRHLADATVFLIHRWTDEISDMHSLMLDAQSGARAQATRLELVTA